LIEEKNIMTQQRIEHDTNKANTTRFFLPLSRLFVALLAPALSLTAANVALAQRTVQRGNHTEGTVRSSASEDDRIRPFHVHIPQTALDDLRRRLAATRWPDKETVADQSQGAQLSNLQALVRYWATDYDWRKAEARLNALPQFKTTIDGVDIHFIHVRSRHKNALPLIITHGWPGSIFEQIKIIGPLTDPTAYGGTADDAFDVVIPSLPGYGFSSRHSNPFADLDIRRGPYIEVTR
jgi:hypothetical protein